MSSPKVIIVEPRVPAPPAPAYIEEYWRDVVRPVMSTVPEFVLKQDVVEARPKTKIMCDKNDFALK